MIDDDFDYQPMGINKALTEWLNSFEKKVRQHALNATAEKHLAEIRKMLEAE